MKSKSKQIDKIEQFDLLDLLGLQLSREEKAHKLEVISNLILKEFILTYIPKLNDRALLEEMTKQLNEHKNPDSIFVELSKHIPTFIEDLLLFTGACKKKYLLLFLDGCLNDIEKKWSPTISELERSDLYIRRLYYQKAKELCIAEKWEELRSHMSAFPKQDIGKRYIEEYTFKQ